MAPVSPVRTLSLLRWASVATAAVIGLWPASPALADPARPGNTVSVVDALSPPSSAVQVDVVGGDAFLRLRAVPGVEVRVPGYQGEPYLWIRSDGTVWRNAESPAAALNEDRYALRDVPDATAKAGEPQPEPRWQSYGSGGTVLWHDHRAHWMGSGDPPTIDPDGLVQRWEVPIEIDGVEVVIRGSLLRRSPASSAWWGVVVVAGALAVGATRRSRRWVVSTALVVGVLVAVVGWCSWAALPAPARPTPVIGVLAVSAAVAAVASWSERLKVLGWPLVAGAGTALVMAGWSGRRGLTAAVVPGLDPAWPWRLGMAAALGVGVVALASGVWHSVRPPAH